MEPKWNLNDLKVARQPVVSVYLNKHLRKPGGKMCKNITKSQMRKMKLLTILPFPLESFGDSNLRSVFIRGAEKKELQMQEKSRAFYRLF